MKSRIKLVMSLDIKKNLSELFLDESDLKNVILFHNCVATVDLKCELDLSKINFRTRNTEYVPSRFTGLTMRITEPKSTALIFCSGRMICTGTRGSGMAYLAARKFSKILKSLGFNVSFQNFKVENLVASCDFRFPIKLEDFHLSHGQFCRYEPEIFPGLIYRLVKPRIVILVFVNGKIVFTGAKSETEIREAAISIYPILKSFQKK